jgi:signal transduction histidine kinase
MQIRTKLALRFSLIVASILLLFSLAVYYLSADYRKQEFYSRLNDKALTTAKLLIEVKEVDHDLMKIIDRNSMNTLFQEKVVIYNYLNQEIYNSVDHDSVSVDKELLDRIRIEGELRYKIGDHEAIGIVYSDRYNRFVVVASAFDKYGLSKLRNLRYVLLVGWLVAVAITMLVGYMYSRDALKPISNVVSQVDKITVSNLNHRVNTKNKADEIGQLAFTFNKMLSRLESAFQVQQAFVSNASHELRTPLTVITGEIDLALMHDREKEEYKKILSTISQDMKNLNRLSNGLLDLAQASLDISSFKITELRFDELLLQSRIDLIKKNPDYHIMITFESLPEDEHFPMVAGNEQLLKIAIINLMENGCKFSLNKKVEVKLFVEADQLRVDFIDNGIGIPPSDIRQVFEPFYRAVNAKDRQGHGIGLPLTQKIIGLHKGTINVRSVLNGGTVFTITLPAKK